MLATLPVSVPRAIVHIVALVHELGVQKIPTSLVVDEFGFDRSFASHHIRYTFHAQLI